MFAIAQQIAVELKVRPEQVQACMQLMQQGATVPFIARYRKEVTGSLDDQQVRQVHERMLYLQELDLRRQAILHSIQEQDQLSPELESAIQRAQTKAELEELYLPYKPKRQTKGQKALLAGIGPLAEQLWQQPELQPEQLASTFLTPAYPDSKAVLTAVRDIWAEQWAEQAHLLSPLRQWFWQQGLLIAQVFAGKENSEEAQKFQQWFEHSEAIRTMPSHRALALLRGQQQGVLQLQLLLDKDASLSDQQALGRLADLLGWQHQGRAADDLISQSIRYCWKVKISTYIDTELMSRLQQRAEEEAIAVFGANLRDLLLAPPAGAKVTLALDPGFRTGTKAVVLSETGELLAHETLFPHAPQKRWQDSLERLALLCHSHQVSLIAIGNGTASRETQQLVKDLLASGIKAQAALVSESGASVYSASPLASKEFPNLDVTYRGAVSIGRRLQDPLAELVKIDPKAIGVGQYQHDLNQSLLKQKLDAVVEDCVNAVGVELNQASAPLLARVAGLSPSLAENIVQYRQQIGLFDRREQLLQVPRLGPKAFEQCAGFLRIRQGSNPLDNSAVHPESYPLVEQLCQLLSKPLGSLIGQGDWQQDPRCQQLLQQGVSQLSFDDLMQELRKPGRDPRPEFRSAKFDELVTDIKDLKPGMRLEGVISNVTDFGAFVDLGVHQDGLVHISMLSDQFIKDPRSLVRAGQVVKVWVIEVDLARKRITLSMKSQYQPEHDSNGQAPKQRTQRQTKPAGPAGAPGAMAQQLAALLKK